MSAAMGHSNSNRLVTRSKIKTIKEDDESSLNKKVSHSMSQKEPQMVRAQSGKVGDTHSMMNGGSRTMPGLQSPKSVDVTLTGGNIAQLADDGNLLASVSVDDDVSAEQLGDIGTMHASKSSPAHSSPLTPKSGTFES